GAAPTDGPREQVPTYPTGLLNYIGNWGGIYGNVALEATEPTWIEQVYVRPDVAARTATFRVTVQSRERAPYTGEVRVSIATRHEGRAVVQVAPGGHAEADIEVSLPDARLWSPDEPHLYTAAITLNRGAREHDRVEERFGMRQLQTRGNVLLLNGQPLYLRGYGDDNVEVLTGFPPSSRAVYLERLRLARSFGFNAVRFHSMTPSEEFFHAADEAGLFVMAELPAAYTQYLLPHKDFLRQELQRVVLSYRNRPSLLSVAFGNEFNLTWLETDSERKAFLETVADFYRLAKSLHPDGLVLSNDGLIMKPTDLVSHFGRGLPDLPTVKHEFGNYYCSLPDISLIDKFVGLFEPEWLHVKRRWVEENGLSDLYPRYVRNSHRLQHLGRKYQIERVRQQPNVTGYHYWLIVDYPGGTGEGDSWEEGWFDYFWRPKGITPREGQEINAAVLPLIDAGVHDRTLWSDATRQIGVTVSNYGDRALRDAPLSWTLVADGRTVAADSTRISVPTGAVNSVFSIGVGPLSAAGAQQLELEIQVNGTHANRWTFWSFPRNGLLESAGTPVASTVKWAGINRMYPFIRQAPAPTGADALLITPTLDDAALRHLRSGGRVWLMAERGGIQPRTEVSFFPAAGGAMGTMVQDHPALQGFPHDGFGDLQFYNLMEGAAPFPLDSWPTSYQPIVGGIRTTAGFLSKVKNLSRVGYVFEARVGAGRLLVTTLRLREHFDEAYPEAIYLFDRFLRYASGGQFAPRTELNDDLLQALMPPR
ncbi:MAG: glycoside hydrolase family 2 TIM barrel-domain containing protein, partial [Vicinamibacterales bacterium]